MTDLEKWEQDQGSAAWRDRHDRSQYSRAVQDRIPVYPNPASASRKEQDDQEWADTFQRYFSNQATTKKKRPAVPLAQPSRTEFGTCTPEYPEGLPPNGLGALEARCNADPRSRSEAAPAPFGGNEFNTSLGFGVLSQYRSTVSANFGSANRPSCMVPKDGPGPAVVGRGGIGSAGWSVPNAAIGNQVRGDIFKSGTVSRYTQSPSRARVYTSNSPFCSRTVVAGRR